MPNPEHQAHFDLYKADVPREQLSPRERRIIQILEIGEKGTTLAQEATIYSASKNKSRQFRSER